MINLNQMKIVGNASHIWYGVGYKVICLKFLYLSKIGNNTLYYENVVCTEII